MIESTTSAPAPDTSKIEAGDKVIQSAFGLGRWAPFQFERNARSTAIRVFWWKALLWLMLGLAFGWALFAGGIYFFVKYQRGFAEVRYGQVFSLILGTKTYRHAKGEFWIKQGLADVEAQKWREAFSSLRAGLAGAPEHIDARLVLARLYLMAGRSDAAARLLLDGLETGGTDMVYLRTVLGFFFAQQADATVITFVGALQDRLAAGTPVQRLADSALAYAYFNRGLLGDARTVLTRYDLLETPEGQLVSARITWEEGRRTESVAQLEALAKRLPGNVEIYRTLVSYLGEMGQWGEVRRVSLLRQFALPDQADAYLDELNAAWNLKDTAAVRRLSEAYLKEFADDPSALIQLAEQAATRGDMELVGRISRRCHEIGKQWETADIVWAMAQLEEGNHAKTEALATRLAGAVSNWPEDKLAILNAVRAVSLYGLQQSTSAEPLIRELLDTAHIPTSVLVRIAGGLEKVGQVAEAKKVLQRALDVDPLSQSASVRLVELLLADAQAEEAAPLMRHLLGMRRPPNDLIRRYAGIIHSDRYLFWAERPDLQNQIDAYMRSRGSPGARGEAQ